MKKSVTRREFMKTTAAAGAGVALGMPLAAGCKGGGSMHQPNIIFIFTDQQHWHATGCLDPFYDTPALNSLAVDGTAFTRAYCSTPQCSPSRSSLMTGYYPHKTGVMGNIGAAGGNHMTMDTIGKKLQAAGYYTGYFGKWHIGHDANGTAGWDESVGPLEKKRPADNELEGNYTGFIDRAAGKKEPFALYVSINDPHDIYKFQNSETDGTVPVTLPASYDIQDFSTVPAVQKQFMDEDQGRVMTGAGREKWEHYRRVYRDKTRLADDLAGAVISKLKEAGVYDNSLVVFTSDHGDMDTHNRLIFKGPFMYDHMLRVPLIIKRPGNGAGARIDGMTVNTDLVPTILEYAGLPADGYDGHSLKAVVDGTTDDTGHDQVIAQYYSKQKWVNPIRSVITEKYKYNRYLKQGEELYNLTDDPGEVKNLATLPAFAEVKQGLSQKLDAWMQKNDDPFNTFTLTDRAGNVKA